MDHYIRMVIDLVSHGMKEHKAITLVAGAYGIDWHILEVVYHHRNELKGESK